MTGATQLLVFDQTLSEVSAVERFAERFRDGAGHLIDASRFLGHLGFFIGRLVTFWNPATISSTVDVWDAAERVEPAFFHMYLSARTLIKRRPSRSEARVPSLVLGEDLDLRLSYAQQLIAGLMPHGARKLRTRQKRELEQTIIDDSEVPPEVRLVLCRARSLPVLMFVYTTGLVDKFESLRELVRQSIREGLDSMIALALGEYDRAGLKAADPPAELSQSLPEPMDIATLEKKWLAVQARWST